ncbi:hypothetical protein GCM10023321_67630 [Pseudonocardia eucalypti]|uniref:Protein kinase domain-containing protein n=1 Tax=Pseudonocardia eucalypti TaxID=648755 RepID=A0ABP9R2Y9_9PSEU|nr:hypothetical protein [Pseudonocardia eucalypti]
MKASSTGQRISRSGPTVGDYHRGSRLRTTRAGTWFPAIDPAGAPAGLLLVHPAVDLKVLRPTIERLAELNLVGVHRPQPELVQQAGRNWLVTAEPAQPTLDDVLDEGEHRTPANAAALLSDVASALVNVHQAGLAHGRLDARSVLIGRGGAALITDWGTDEDATPNGDIRAWTRLTELLAEFWCADVVAAAPLARAANAALTQGLHAAMDHLRELHGEERRDLLARLAEDPPEPRRKPRPKATPAALAPGGPAAPAAPSDVPAPPEPAAAGRPVPPTPPGTPGPTAPPGAPELAGPGGSPDPAVTPAAPASAHTPAPPATPAAWAAPPAAPTPAAWATPPAEGTPTPGSTPIPAEGTSAPGSTPIPPGSTPIPADGTSATGSAPTPAEPTAAGPPTGTTAPQPVSEWARPDPEAAEASSEADPGAPPEAEPDPTSTPTTEPARNTGRDEGVKVTPDMPTLVPPGLLDQPPPRETPARRTGPEPETAGETDTEPEPPTEAIPVLPITPPRPMASPPTRRPLPPPPLPPGRNPKRAASTRNPESTVPTGSPWNTWDTWDKDKQRATAPPERATTPPESATKPREPWLGSRRYVKTLRVLVAVAVVATLADLYMLLGRSDDGPSELQITSVALRTRWAGPSCTLIGVITTNGKSGTIAYGWTGDIGAGTVNTQKIAEGRTQLEVERPWDPASSPIPDPVITLQVLQPEQRHSSAKPAAICHR